MESVGWRAAILLLSMNRLQWPVCGSCLEALWLAAFHLGGMHDKTHFDLQKLLTLTAGATVHVGKSRHTHVAQSCIVFCKLRKSVPNFSFFQRTPWVRKKQERARGKPRWMKKLREMTPRRWRAGRGGSTVGIRNTLEPMSKSKVRS